MGEAIERLVEAIRYPGKVPEGAVSFAMRVDDIELLAEEIDGRIVMSWRLSGDDAELPKLAEYAAGRMLRERAALAYENEGRTAVLWQDAPADAEDRELTRFFETFMDSCDWWRARLDDMRGEGGPVAEEEVLIRP